MPGFCVNCGTPLTGPFCNRCGAQAVLPASSAVAQPAPPPSTPTPQPSYHTVNVPAASAQLMPQTPIQSYQPAPPVLTTTKSSGLGKVLLWVGGILFVL